MELVLPTNSITKEFLEGILHRKIAHFKTSEGSNPGDNFTSILISVEVQFADDESPIHLLYKTFPSHPTRQKLLVDTNVFLKEFLVYDSWIPELIQFQRDIGLEKILKPAVPEMVAGAAIDYESAEVNLNQDPMRSNYILMVDIRKMSGYKMANKLKSLSYHHVKVVLEELAKFHALCYAFKVHHDLPSMRSSFSFLTDPFFNNPDLETTMNAIIEMNFKLIKETLGKFLEENPEIAKSLEKFEDPGSGTKLLQTFLNSEGMDEEEVERLMRFKPDKYSSPPLQDQWIVAGHGDCWTNNMLFKSDEETGKVTGAVLVDLQVARECCIMADIVYFLYTSTGTEFRAKYMNEMLTFYHENFISFCTTFTVNPFKEFTFENFKRKFHRSKIFGFIFACIVCPIILQKPETSLDLETVQIDENVEGNKDDFATMLQQASRDDDDTKLLRERFQNLLTELYEEGVL